MENEEDDSMLYKSMLNKTLGLPDFNQYSYLFEDENGDTESLLNTPSTDAEMSNSIAEELTSQISHSRPSEPLAEALPSKEPKEIDQMTRRNQQLQRYWESQQKESQIIEEKLSSIRVRVEQNENQWEKEKSKLLSPQSRIPKPGRSSVSALDMQLEVEREKRIELEVQCSDLNRQLQELQKEMESKGPASLRVETLKQMQKRHADEIGELHEQAEHSGRIHAKEIAGLQAVLHKCQQHSKRLELEKSTLIATQRQLKDEIEQLESVQLQQKGEILTLEEQLREERVTRQSTEENYIALEQKIEQKSLDFSSLRKIVSSKEEDKAIIAAKLAESESEKTKLHDALLVLEDQKHRAEQEIDQLKTKLQEAIEALANASSTESAVCRKELAEWREKYEQECNENTRLRTKLQRCEEMGGSFDFLETKRQKSIDRENSTKSQEQEPQIQQLEENYQTEIGKLNAEIEAYRTQVADLNVKYEDARLKLRTKLEQDGEDEERTRQMKNQVQEKGKKESMVQNDPERRTLLKSETTRADTSQAHDSSWSTSFNASLQNHVTRIETEHADEIQELLDGLGQEQTGAIDWSAQFESRNESKDAFSTPFKVKSNATDGNISGSVLSPILRSGQSDAASVGSDIVQRKIDGLMEEIGLMDQEREELLGVLEQDVSNSKTLGSSIESELVEHATATSQNAQSSVSGSQNLSNELPSNDILDGTILLLNNLKDLMCGQEQENDKERSVWDQLEALSEMMGSEAQFHSGSVSDTRPDKMSAVSALRMSAHTRVSSSIPSSSKVHEHLDDLEPDKQKEPVWRVLVAELRHRISFLEHDRNEVVRITGEMLERERDANRLKLESAVSSARRKAFEEFQTLMVGNS